MHHFIAIVQESRLRGGNGLKLKCFLLSRPSQVSKLSVNHLFSCEGKKLKRVSPKRKKFTLGMYSGEHSNLWKGFWGLYLTWGYGGIKLSIRPSVSWLNKIGWPTPNPLDLSLLYIYNLRVLHSNFRRGPYRNLPSTVSSRTTDYWKRRCC
jgi:hypothetical protein